MKKTRSKKILKGVRAVVDKRLDNALVTLLKREKPGAENVPSRAFLTRLIKEGEVTVNGQAVKPHYLIRLGDKIAFPEDFPEKTPPFFVSPTSHPEVLFENPDFLVINKPAPFLVHPTETSREETLAHFLRSQYPALGQVGEHPLRPGIVHRLDRETSGLLLVAKHQAAYLALKKLFQERKVEKTYLALLYGHLPALGGLIEAPLTRLSGEIRRKVVKKAENKPKSREAVTQYRVRVRYQDYDFVAVFPKTGRTHQIRVHFASLGHPVVGDKLYAFRSHKRGSSPLPFPSRQLLHAWQLSFSYGGKDWAFEAPLPPDFQEALAHIDETREEGYDDEALKSLN